MALSLGPEWEFQVAIVTALKASADIAALLGNDDGTQRIYEVVPDDPTFPYVILGECQNVPDRAECIEGADLYADLHVWDRPANGSFETSKTVASTILAVVIADDLVMNQNRVVDCYADSRRHMRDPDGVTLHSVLTLKALTEPV
jgi:hypothetical protein